MRFILTTVVVALLAAMPGAARAADPAAKLAGPWPNGPVIERIEGQEVTFASASPFSPAEFADLASAPKATARATLFMPPGRHKPGSLPAVIMLHGSGGVLWAREMTYGRQLAAMGVAALVIDAFAARRELGAGFIDRLLNITESMMIADAYAGLSYLAAQHPGIDTGRVALVGFSYGAMASMYAMNARVAAQLGKGLKFAGHVAFYGPCIARFSDPRTTGAPLLYLYGTADILIDRARCETFAADLKKGGSSVEIVAYKDAPHQWDGGWGRRTIGRTMHACRLWVERDGTVRDLNTLLPMSTPFLRKVILGLCASGPPYPIGADEETRAKSNRDMGHFLARVFGRAH
ncbi:MAG TPA: dienelactone hydrolase family protein [Alphaproteobacteria bacterium]|jgi:dienelactone hydrolase